MFTFIRKELLLFIRRPQELLILLAMPFGLITILGFSLGTVMDNEAVPVDVAIGIAQPSGDEDEVARLIQDSGVPLPEEAAEAIEANSLFLNPVELLRLQVLESEELAEFVTVEELESGEVEAARQQGKLTAIIEVPDNFTETYIASLFEGESAVPELTVYLNEDESFASGIVKEIITQFQEQYSQSVELGRAGLLGNSSQGTVQEIESEVRTVGSNGPVNAMEYYTAGIAVMFVLFTGATVAIYVYNEKKDRIFDRILLANVSPWSYLMSIVFTTIILSLGQLLFLFGGSWLFYGVRFDNFLLFSAITVLLSLTVGAIAALLSALSIRSGNIGISTMFQNAIVPILAFLGGSYINVSSLGMVSTIGNYTPNGTAMSAYLQLLRGEALTDIQSSLVILAVTCGLCFVASILVFPRKGGVV